MHMAGVYIQEMNRAAMFGSSHVALYPATTLTIRTVVLAGGGLGGTTISIHNSPDVQLVVRGCLSGDPLGGSHGVFM